MNECLQQAEQDRLLAQLAAQYPNRFLQLARGTLHATGHLLLAIGLRLYQVDAPPTQVQIGHAVTGK